MPRSNVGRAAVWCALLTWSCGGREAEPSSETGTGPATTGGAAGGPGASATSSSAAGGASSTSGTGTTTIDVGTTSTSTSSTSGGGSDNEATTGFGSTVTGRCGSSAPGAGGSGGAPPNGPAPGAKAIVLQRKDFPPPPPSPSGSSSTSGTTGGGGIDPETWHLAIGTGSLSCQEPYGGSACGTWQLFIHIEPALFKPGSIDLCGIATFFAQDPDRGGGNCSGGGGTYDQGKLEILSIGPDTVRVRLSGTRTSDLDADGQYDVLRCH